MTTLDHLSYSSISSYLMCAANWKMHYIDKITGPTSTALVFGSAFHGTIEKFLEEREIGRKTQSKALDVWEDGTILTSTWLETWRETINTKVGDKFVPRQDIDWGLDTPEFHCNEGVRLFSHPDIKQGILSMKPHVWPGGKPAIETYVELHVPGVPIPIVGYIDLIEVAISPADIKTSSKSWNDDKAADEIQTLFYLAALNQAGIEAPDWEFTHYVFVKTKTPQFQKFTHKHNPAQLMWLFKMIQNVWKGIDAGVFPENPGTWKCNPKYCEYWGLCRGKNGG